MNVDLSRTDQGLLLKLNGPWDGGDGGVLRASLASLPREATPLEVDISELDSLPLGLLQVLWAYIRHARGSRRPVLVRMAPSQGPLAETWGLTGGGWEGYFYVR